MASHNGRDSKELLPNGSSSQRPHERLVPTTSHTNGHAVQQQQPQPQQQQQEHSCEICGMSGMSDEAMRDHTRQNHVEGSAQCPFCGLSGVPAAELLLHVNQAHLDYLTPENELMSFIDDQTPSFCSVDGDSDSISDCRGLSPSITSELLTPVSGAVGGRSLGASLTTTTTSTNGMVIGSSNTSSYCSTNSTTNHHSQHQMPPTATTSYHLPNGNTSVSTSGGCSRMQTSSLSNTSTAAGSSVSMSSSRSSLGSSSSNLNASGSQLANGKGPSANHLQHLPETVPSEQVGTNGTISKDQQGGGGAGGPLLNGGGAGCTTPAGAGAGGQGSPLRSQLGLKLKTNKPNGSGTPVETMTIATTATVTTITTKQASPLQCLLCPYTSDNPSVLEEHINRSHFDPLSPGVNGGANGAGSCVDGGGSGGHHVDTLSVLQCPICNRTFESGSDLELHVNIEHRDILSPAKAGDGSRVANGGGAAGGPNGTAAASSAVVNGSYGGNTGSLCPVCGISFDHMRTQDMEYHIERHFSKSPQHPYHTGNIPGAGLGGGAAAAAAATAVVVDLEKQAQKLREQREFEMLRAQYGMDDQGNFREQSAAAMQRAVYAGEMSVADYYERQVGLRAAESHGVDDGSSCTKSVSPRVLSLSSSSPNVIKTYVCSSVDHYASSYGDKGWGCGYRNLQMMLSSLLQNTSYNEALYSAWGSHGPARTAMPSISRLQRMVEAAWAQGFDIQGSEQLGCKLYNTRKWIGATEIVTVLSWLRIRCKLVDFHRPTSVDGRHPELFNWVLRYFEEPRIHTPPLYLQHQGHSRTIIGIEQRTSGLSLLVLDPSHGPRQVAALGSSQDSLRLIRKNSAAMRAPQYQVVAVTGLIETEEQYQASKVLKSLHIPPDR
ncbi:zinc finger with UFM1-specific peptidase domain protein [Anopheles darlingi]|uniref:Zinc finger-containing ubiquitin peptidase 1 n=1 Tax=Anopheles darlingi TaxID=43151 RepID=W5JC14_ANODA|nr:zinc finger with UFM1-specific peptidase domain protein [Anopheles darlingi]